MTRRTPRTLSSLGGSLRHRGQFAGLVREHAREGDEACARVVADIGERLGAALATVCAVLDPEMIVVGGELAHAGELLLRPVRESLEDRALVTAAGPVQVVESALGDQAEVRGALALALDAARVTAPVAMVQR